MDDISKDIVLSKQKWYAQIVYWAEGILKGTTMLHRKPHWIATREIRILWEEGIDQETVRIVQEAIRERLEEVGLSNRGFRIQPYGTGWRERGEAVKMIDYISPALRSGGVDHEKLFQLSYDEPYRRAEQHADVYILTKPFHDDDDKASWGVASFGDGCMIISLSGNRQRNRSFLRNVVRHEMAHLLGQILHCNDLFTLEGTTYDPTCNMHWEVPSGKLCPKCQHYLKLWWEVVRTHYGS